MPPSEVSSDGVVKKYFREESVSTESPDPSSLEPSSVKISDTGKWQFITLSYDIPGGPENI